MDWRLASFFADPDLMVEFKERGEALFLFAYSSPHLTIQWRQEGVKASREKERTEEE